MEIYGFILISMDLYRFCVDLHGFTCILHGFKLIYMFLYGSMLIYMRFNVSIYFFDVFISLVWPSSVPQAVLFFRKKRHSWIFDYVNPGNCKNSYDFSIYGFWDLSKKTRAEK